MQSLLILSLLQASDVCHRKCSSQSTVFFNHSGRLGRGEERGDTFPHRPNPTLWRASLRRYLPRSRVQGLFVAAVQHAGDGTQPPPPRYPATPYPASPSVLAGQAAAIHTDDESQQVTHVTECYCPLMHHLAFENKRQNESMCRACMHAMIADMYC